MNESTTPPGELIAAAMRRRGLSAYALSDLTGEVSPTTVRNYIRLREPGRGYRLRSLFRVAEALGEDGPPILEAFGEQASADRLRAELSGSRKRPAVSYEGPALTEAEADAVRHFIRALQHSRSELEDAEPVPAWMRSTATTGANGSRRGGRRMAGAF